MAGLDGLAEVVVKRSTASSVSISAMNRRLILSAAAFQTVSSALTEDPERVGYCLGKWMAANGRESAGHSWEIYGDPTPDPADTETTVVYLLK